MESWRKWLFCGEITLLNSNFMEAWRQNSEIDSEEGRDKNDLIVPLAQLLWFMKNLLTRQNSTYYYDKQNNKYGKIKKIGDEKLWKVYIKK